MKALSVRQPFAMDIACGAKTIELRSRPTSHRGDLLICSTKGGPGLWLNPEGSGLYYKCPMGAMMCVVEVVDCRPAKKDDWEEAACHPDDIVPGMWAWVMRRKHAVESRPVIGRLSLFEVPAGDIVVLPLDDEMVWPDEWYDEIVDSPPRSGLVFVC